MTFRRATVTLLASLAVGLPIGPTQAFDLFSATPFENQSGLPAVSAVNGRVELDAGLLSESGILQMAGSLALPISDVFGVQGDFTSIVGSEGLRFAAVTHAFTRDPGRYLAGFAGGVVVTPDSTLVAGGFEGELYVDRFTLDTWIGLASLGDGETGPFVMTDVFFYPRDDLRLVAGGAAVLGDASLHLGAEYLLHQFSVPVSLIGDARLRADGNSRVTFGLRGYLGGMDPDKPLIARDREDLVPLRSIDLLGASLGYSRSSPPDDDDEGDDDDDDDEVPEG